MQQPGGCMLPSLITHSTYLPLPDFATALALGYVLVRRATSGAILDPHAICSATVASCGGTPCPSPRCRAPCHFSSDVSANAASCASILTLRSLVTAVWS